MAVPFNRVVEKLGTFYVAMVRKVLRHRRLSSGLAVAAFVCTMALVQPLIGRDLMPPMDAGFVNVLFELPPSASVRRVEEVLTTVESVIHQEPSVRMMSSIVGSEPGEVSFGAGSQTAQKVSIIVTLTTREQSDRSIWAIQNEWRERIAKIRGIRSLQI